MMKMSGSNIPRNPTTRRMNRYELVYASSLLVSGYLLCVFSLDRKSRSLSSKAAITCPPASCDARTAVSGRKPRLHQCDYSWLCRPSRHFFYRLPDCDPVGLDTSTPYGQSVRSRRGTRVTGGILKVPDNAFFRGRLQPSRN